MATKSIAWTTGSGNITVDYGGSGDGTITITTDSNSLYEARSQQITVRTTDGSDIQRTITIQQAAKVRIDISTAVVTAASQTYSGSAKTPTPTVTLNGVTVPSTGYDVAYSDNTNAGTATITVTGKDDYTGTATGTFTIAKANPTYTAPTANSLTYNGNSRYLTTTGSTSDGTIQYSADGSTWSTTRVTKTTAGTYTTYWRLVGDANHNDVESTPITTTINKASRTISFGNTYYVQNTSTTTTRTATPSAGSSDGAITYSISSTTYATINSSSGAVTSKTSDGSATVTATIAEGTNYLSASGSYTLYVFATTHDYSYSGSYSSVTLPPGTYQFQVWGAQGGSNAAYSTYGITAKAGGKGGYSVGQLTVSEATGVRVYVGGQGSSSSGGYNGGGSTKGTSQYNSSNTLGYSKMGGGGGATDIRLSDGALLSRMIVAGGGSGGAMCYKAVTSSSSSWDTISSGSGEISFDTSQSKWTSAISLKNKFVNGKQYKVSLSGSGVSTFSVFRAYYFDSSWVGKGSIAITNGESFTWNNSYPYVILGLFPSYTGINSTVNVEKVSGYQQATIGAYYTVDYSNVCYKEGTYSAVVILPGHAFPQWDLNGGERFSVNGSYYLWNGSKLVPMDVSFTVQEYKTTSTTTTSTDSQVGYVGGGTNGGGYSSSYYGSQSSAGSGGSFGTGAAMSTTGYRYCSGAGGGGWYGGGCAYSDSTMSYVRYMGGGSGWVNTSASSGNRPSGYTGLQLDSGTTYAGNTSFPSTSGGSETGHSGNGYARITRL